MPLFERTWASLYEALEDGQIDAKRLREVYVQFALLPEKGQVVFLRVSHKPLARFASVVSLLKAQPL